MAVDNPHGFVLLKYDEESKPNLPKDDFDVVSIKTNDMLLMILTNKQAIVLQCVFYYRLIDFTGWMISKHGEDFGDLTEIAYEPMVGFEDSKTEIQFAQWFRKLSLEKFGVNPTEILSRKK